MSNETQCGGTQEACMAHGCLECGYIDKDKQIAGLKAQLDHERKVVKELGKLIHYPACWDTSVYQTVLEAYTEHFGCHPFKCQYEYNELEHVYGDSRPIPRRLDDE